MSRSRVKRGSECCNQATHCPDDEVVTEFRHSCRLIQITFSFLAPVEQNSRSANGSRDGGEWILALRTCPVPKALRKSILERRRIKRRDEKEGRPGKKVSKHAVGHGRAGASYAPLVSPARPPSDALSQQGVRITPV